MNSNIRNFCIVAHVDHGKSTLADRFLEITGTVPKEQLKEQFLDSNPIARERGITIKLAPVRMEYKVQNPDSTYVLNLIDTPGHVDFSYEVIRTLYACEGAILLVDATKGIQAQTVAHYNFAKKIGLVLIPVINKIDLPTADIERTTHDISSSFGFSQDEILKISAKTGLGVKPLIEHVIRQFPPPPGNTQNPTQALIFDSVYDEHRGIVIYVRLKNGRIKKGDEIVFLSDKSTASVLDIGYMKPSYSSTDTLMNGEVGFIITNIKDITHAKVGDTISIVGQEAEPLPGYTPLKPFVFLSMYPSSTSDFQSLRKSLFTLKLNDAALEFTPEQSALFGPGYRCGFLGLLHAQIVLERIEREFGLDVFAAPPSITYLVNGKEVSNPKDFDTSTKEVLEPYAKADVYTPSDYLGKLLELIYQKRGQQKDIIYFGSQVKIVFEIPLSSIIIDFYDKVKSLSSGFASFDYEFLEYRVENLVKVDIVLNDKVVPEFSFIAHKDEAYHLSQNVVDTLKQTIPKHQFVVTIQARIGARIIVSQKIPALHKHVIAKLSGGDYTRKAKLLEKQKKGKEKLKMVGQVNIPKEAFLAILKT